MNTSGIENLNTTKVNKFMLIAKNFSYVASSEAWFKNGKLCNIRDVKKQIKNAFGIEAIGDTRELLHLIDELKLYVVQSSVNNESYSGVKLARELIREKIKSGEIFPLLYPFSHPNGAVQYFKETGNGKEVSPLAKCSHESFHAIFVNPDNFEKNKEVFIEVNQRCFKEKEPLSLKKFSSLTLDVYKDLPERQLLTEPSFISFDKGEVTFSYHDMSKIVPGEYPAWEEFLCRLEPSSDARKFFMAFVASVFIKEHQGRRVLVLVGPGMDGKSVVLDVISSFVGASAMSVNNLTFKNNRFIGSSLYGKRLIVYGDCKNKKVLRTEIVHQFTGGDSIPIEFKGETPFNAKVYGRMMIATNDGVEIGDKVNEKSRLCLLRVKPNSLEIIENGDTGWKERLKSEFYYFLHDCFEVYEKLCPSNGNIQLSEDLKNFRDDNVDDEIGDFLKVFMEESLIFKKGEWIKSADLLKRISEELRHSGIRANANHVLSDLKRILREQYDCKTGARVSKDNSSRCIKGVSLKGDF